MKTSNFLAIAATMITLSGSLMSCKKDKDERPDCRIITVTPTTGDAINISYNDEGKVATLTQGSRITTYAYSGSTSVATTMNGGVFSDRKITTSNANGMTINQRTENDMAGTSWSNQAFEYSGTELIKSTVTTSTGGAPSVSIYTWSNGNLATATSGSTVTTLDYYMDKSQQPGDYLLLSQLVQGYFIFKNKNLIKSLLTGSSITSFSYTTGSDGNISSAVGTVGSTVETFNLQYQCN